MRIRLTKAVVNKLDFNRIPYDWDEKTNTWKERVNANRRPYVIFDASPNVATGFGIRVGEHTKTYIVQVRVRDKVVKHTLGRHPDLLLDTSLESKSARALAADAVLRLKRGEPLNLIKKNERGQQDGFLFSVLIDDYIAAYTADCLNRQKQPKANTIQAIKKARERLRDWHDKSVQDITPVLVEKKFDELASQTPTAAEQTMRWANAAFKRLIIFEKHRSQQEGRDPLVVHNPIEILRDLKKFRSKRELEESYDKKQVRKPISNDQNHLGCWLGGVWELRQRNVMAADYQLCTLLLGARRRETAMLKWVDKLGRNEKSSYVDLERKRVMFQDTKNGTDHELPMGDVLHEILKQRRIHGGDSAYVFPNRSKRSKGLFYSDPRSFMDSVSRVTHIEYRMHDLRRTFATVVNLMEIPTITTKRLLNHSQLTDDTAKYARVMLDDLRPYMQKVENELLKHAPQIRKGLFESG